MTGANNSTTFADIARGGNAPHTVTRQGDAKISTAIADPFSVSGGVGAFDGTGDYLSAPKVNDFALAQNITIEFWAKANWANTQPLCGVGGGAGNWEDTNGHEWLIFTFNSQIYLQYHRAGATLTSINGSHGLSGSDWVHFALVINNYAVAAYVNGVSKATGTLSGHSQTTSGTQILSVGGQPDGAAFTGNLADFAITLRAKYTANFTPPARLSPYLP
jgi:hypothetical protein